MVREGAHAEMIMQHNGHHPEIEVLSATEARGAAVPAAGFLQSVEAFARQFAQRHSGSLVRLTLDAALESPAGRPPFDAILNLWTKPGDVGVPAEFRWTGGADAALVLEIESIEAATETLGL